MNKLKIAVIHEWLITIAGSEKVVQQVLSIYPSADLFVVCADPILLRNVEFLKNRNIVTSFIQNIPKASKIYTKLLPLMPLAVEQFDLSGYDLVISSAHAVSKGALTGPDQLHISYVHSPMRYAWDLQHQYLRESGLSCGLKGWIAKWLLHKMRIWDFRTSAGVDHFVANSHFIGRRIRKVYGRCSDVIYPPVDVDAFELCAQKQDYYLAASRLVPYKRMDLIVEAFARMPDKNLVVIGDGPEMPKLRALAKKNVALLGYQQFSELRRHMQQAKAFVFAAEEDFGITPVEAQACGTPVIAYGKGGARETVVDSPDVGKATGILFPEQSAEAIVQAIQRFETLPYPISPLVCRQRAELFSIERFRNEFERYVNARWDEFKKLQDQL
ncbi:MAG: glycosyltransferase family 4 protein [Nevskiaceae bacterium]|nr:MAG: glycosyltransferase family 4 protein [Nevskiaceae bacterium]